VDSFVPNAEKPSNSIGALIDTPISDMARVSRVRYISREHHREWPTRTEEPASVD
jgi:hypothetical protein